MGKKLKLVGRVSEKLVSQLGLHSNYQDDKIVVMFAHFSEFEIPLNTKFCKLLDQDGNEYKIDSTLIEITQQFGKPFSEVPKGWKTIVVLKFKDNIPDSILDIDIVDDWYESQNELLVETS